MANFIHEAHGSQPSLARNISEDAAAAAGLTQLTSEQLNRAERNKQSEFEAVLMRTKSFNHLLHLLKGAYEIQRNKKAGLESSSTSAVGRDHIGTGAHSEFFSAKHWKFGVQD